MEHDLGELYQLYKMCVVRITVTTPAGDTSTGAGFHIGDGYIVTARHVVEGVTIAEVVGHHYADHHDRIAVRRILYAKDGNADVAILETDFALTHFMEKVHIIVGESKERKKENHIPVGGHLDDWIGDEFTMSKVLLMGFPPVPFSREATLVAVEAEVNAVVDPRHVDHPCFIVSAIPRGGFSGGPAISEYGMLLGVVTEALFEGDHSELGFATVLSIEPIIGIMLDHHVYPAGASKEFLEELLATVLSTEGSSDEDMRQS